MEKCSQEVQNWNHARILSQILEYFVAKIVDVLDLTEVTVENLIVLVSIVKLQWNKSGRWWGALVVNHPLPLIPIKVSGVNYYIEQSFDIANFIAYTKSHNSSTDHYTVRSYCRIKAHQMGRPVGFPSDNSEPYNLTFLLQKLNTVVRKAHTIQQLARTMFTTRCWNICPSLLRWYSLKCSIIYG